MKILIVEDEIIIAMRLAQELEELGYDADVAVNGKSAIEHVRKKRPDLLIMDVRLRRGVDGITLAHEICQESDIPLLFITGHSDQATIDRAQALKPVGFLVKPVETEEILAAIQTIEKRFPPPDVEPD